MKKYPIQLRLIHHFIAIALIFNIALGLIMEELPQGELRHFWYSFHKQVGVTIFILLILRTYYRFFKNTLKLKNKFIRIMHYPLYFIMFSIVTSGYVLSSSYDKAIYFLFWQIPDLIPYNASLGHLAGEIHEIIGYSSISIIATHVCFVLYQFYKKKGKFLLKTIL